jgi:hypothetical protein
MINIFESDFLKFCTNNEGNILSIVILEALTTFINEGKFAEDIQQSLNSYKSTTNLTTKQQTIINYKSNFSRFVRTFSVHRNIKGGKQLDVITEAFNSFLPNLYSGTYNEINTFSSSLKTKGLTPINYKSGQHINAISLASKIAFIYMPEFFSPYDNLAKKALKKFNLKNKLYINNIDNDYQDFMTAYNLYLNKVKADNDFNNFLRTKSYNKIVPKHLSQNLIQFDVDFLNICKKLNIQNTHDFLIRRIVDKSLMLFGGYDINTMIKDKINKKLL